MVSKINHGITGEDPIKSNSNININSLKEFSEPLKTYEDTSEKTLEIAANILSNKSSESEISDETSVKSFVALTPVTDQSSPSTTEEFDISQNIDDEIPDFIKNSPPTLKRGEVSTGPKTWGAAEKAAYKLRLVPIPFSLKTKTEKLERELGQFDFKAGRALRTLEFMEYWLKDYEKACGEEGVPYLGLAHFPVEIQKKVVRLMRMGSEDLKARCPELFSQYSLLVDPLADKAKVGDQLYRDFHRDIMGMHIFLRIGNDVEELNITSMKSDWHEKFKSIDKLKDLIQTKPDQAREIKFKIKDILESMEEMIGGRVSFQLKWDKYYRECVDGLDEPTKSFSRENIEEKIEKIHGVLREFDLNLSNEMSYEHEIAYEIINALKDHYEKTEMMQVFQALTYDIPRELTTLAGTGRAKRLDYFSTIIMGQEGLEVEHRFRTTVQSEDEMIEDLEGVQFNCVMDYLIDKHVCISHIKQI